LGTVSGCVTETPPLSLGVPGVSQAQPGGRRVFDGFAQ
jgi:hypothetical protein